MARLHANNFITTLNGGISSGATSIILTSVTGFPAVGGGDTCNVTLANGADIEIVTATAISSFTLTVTRGAEGTIAKAFANGSIVSIRPTAGSFDGKADLDSPTFTGTVTIPTPFTLGAVSVLPTGTELNYVDGVTSNIQTQLDAKAAGAASSTDNAVARFDSTTGKIIQNSGVIIDDSNNITGPLSIAASSYLQAGGNATASGYIELLEDSDNGSNKVTIIAPSSIASDKTITLQDVTGTVYVTGGTDVAVADGGTGTSSAGIGAFNNITGYTAAGATGTTSTNLVFSTSPTLVTPTLGVASATSINFGQDALNYYDEGTFTPTTTFSTPGDLSVVYTQQIGQYTRIGNIVHINVYLAWTPTYTTASSSLTIGGLPFTPSQTGGAEFVSGNLDKSAFTLNAGGTAFSAMIAGGVMYLVSGGTGVASTVLTTANFPSAAAQFIYFSMYYHV